MMKQETDYRSGFVGIIGRPNVGKSTLLNAILGEKVSIISPKPQTTRNTIRGIKHFPNAQIVFLDTPGIHAATRLLNQFMVEAAILALKEIDVLLFVLEPELKPEDSLVMDIIAKLDRPKFCIINKIDRVYPLQLLPLIDTLSKTNLFSEIIPVSALNQDGLDRILDGLLKYLPEGPSYFPEEMMTDQPERFLVSEIIREKVFLLTGEEIPYATAVEIDTFEKNEEQKRLLIEATIHVEKDSQKKIVIGKGGSLIKEVGILARKELEEMLNVKIFLTLWVRVQKDWTRKENILKDFGYR